MLYIVQTKDNKYYSVNAQSLADAFTKEHNVVDAMLYDEFMLELRRKIYSVDSIEKTGELAILWDRLRTLSSEIDLYDTFEKEFDGLW